MVDADESLDGGMEFGMTLFAQPVPAGTAERETDATPPRFHAAEHVPGLVPIAIEEQDLELVGWSGCGES